MDISTNCVLVVVNETPSHKPLMYCCEESWQKQERNYMFLSFLDNARPSIRDSSQLPVLQQTKMVHPMHWIHMPIHCF